MLVSSQVDLLELATLFSLCVVNNLPRVCCMQVCCLQLLLMVLLAVMLLPYYIDVLVDEQLDVFMGRKVHRHLIECIPKCALNDVFNSSFLEAIVPVLLRDK